VVTLDMMPSGTRKEVRARARTGSSMVTVTSPESAGRSYA
jgi:hypothetical protein